MAVTSEWRLIHNKLISSVHATVHAHTIRPTRPPGTVVPGGLIFCCGLFICGTLRRYISEMDWTQVVHRKTVTQRPKRSSLRPRGEFVRASIPCFTTAESLIPRWHKVQHTLTHLIKYTGISSATNYTASLVVLAGSDYTRRIPCAVLYKNLLSIFTRDSRNCYSAS